MNALIYLRIDGPVMTGEDLQRLHLLHRYTLDAGYTVTEMWPVFAPFESPYDQAKWANAQQDLEEGRFAAVIHWHEGADMPYLTTRTA